MKILTPTLVLALVSSASAESICRSGSQQIPDDGLTAAAWMLDVPEDGIVTAASVSVNIVHDWVGDLRIVLTAPDGLAVTLLDRPGMPDSAWIGPWGCGGDDIEARFTDQSSTAAESMCSVSSVPVIAGEVLPAEPLSALIGHPAQGQWSLRVHDDSPVDSGLLLEACLELQTAADCNGNGLPDETDIADGDSADIDGNGIPDECECPSDVTGDARVDVEDILAIIAAFGQSDPDRDVDGDGIVGITDLLLVLENWNDC